MDSSLPAEKSSTPMTNTGFRRLLKQLGACREGVAWVGRRDLETAWNECERADWCLWLAGALDIEPSVFARVAIACAQTALQYVPAGEERPRLAIEAAIRCVEHPTEKNRQAAARAADAAAHAAARAVADAAAYAAAYAARAAADAAASAATSAAASAATSAAASAAARAADVAARAAAYAETRQKMAAIVREHISVDMIVAAIGERERFS